MDQETLKSNFDEQLANTDKQIKELEEGLEKAREYKIKLLGGLETLRLLAEEPAEEATAEETAAE